MREKWATEEGACLDAVARSSHRVTGSAGKAPLARRS